MLSERLRALREARGLTREALAQLSGISLSYISELEANPTKNPGVQYVVKLAAALQVPFGALITDEREEDHLSPEWASVVQLARELQFSSRSVARLLRSVAACCHGREGLGQDV